MFTKEEQALAKAMGAAIKKISKGKWEWKPEVGELCIYNPRGFAAGQVVGEVGLVWSDKSYGGEVIEVMFRNGLTLNARASEFIPLLHWEKNEEIMRKLGYYLTLEQSYWGMTRLYRAKFWYRLGDQDKIKDQPYNSKTRQEAIMKAVEEV